MRRILPEGAVLRPPDDASSEHWHQAWLVKTFRQAMPNDTLFAIPNGGKRGKALALKLQIEGVLAGVWDIFWLEESMFIEMKTPSGRLSADQFAFGESAERAGYRLLVGYGWRDAWNQIQHGERKNWRERLQK